MQVNVMKGSCNSCIRSTREALPFLSDVRLKVFQSLVNFVHVSEGSSYISTVNGNACIKLLADPELCPLISSLCINIFFIIFDKLLN